MKERNNIIEARRFQKFLNDLGIVSPIQYFDRYDDEITCITAQVIVIVSEGKALVTWENDQSKSEYIVEETPTSFRAFREYQKVPTCSVISVDNEAPVKEYQIRRHEENMATAI